MDDRWRGKRGWHISPHCRCHLPKSPPPGQLRATPLFCPLGRDPGDPPPGATSSPIPSQTPTLKFFTQATIFQEKEQNSGQGPQPRHPAPSPAPPALAASRDPQDPPPEVPHGGSPHRGSSATAVPVPGGAWQAAGSMGGLCRGFVPLLAWCFVAFQEGKSSSRFPWGTQIPFAPLGPNLIWGWGLWVAAHPTDLGFSHLHNSFWAALCCAKPRQKFMGLCSEQGPRQLVLSTPSAIPEQRFLSGFLGWHCKIVLAPRRKHGAVHRGQIPSPHPHLPAAAKGGLPRNTPCLSRAENQDTPTQKYFWGADLAFTPKPC